MINNSFLLLSFFPFNFRFQKSDCISQCAFLQVYIAHSLGGCLFSFLSVYICSFNKLYKSSAIISSNIFSYLFLSSSRTHISHFFQVFRLDHFNYPVSSNLLIFFFFSPAQILLLIHVMTFFISVILFLFQLLYTLYLLLCLYISILYIYYLFIYLFYLYIFHT